MRKLGVKAWGRLHDFRHYYSPGWGDGDGRPLSPRSLEGFHRFLQAATFSRERNPSVFLTDAGTLELCWEGDAGKSLQIEFTPTGAEYYIEANGAEGEVSYAEVSRLAQLTAD